MHLLRQSFGSRPKIAIFGAFDRFNYGDLVFPIVLARYLKPRLPSFDLEFVSLRRSDLSRRGAVPTRPVRWMKGADHMPDGSVVVVAGGEVLGAGWSQLHCQHFPQPIGDFALRQLGGGRMSQRTSDRFSQRFFRAGWPIPFVVRPSHFENQVTTIFNAVGGTGLDNMPEFWREEVYAALGEAANVTVRDGRTLEAVNRRGQAASLAADCAGVLGDLFPVESLSPRLKEETREILDRRANGGFVCFQIHRYFSEKRLNLFASQLSQFRGHTGLEVVLLPIGCAPGHSDQLSLREVAKKMTGDVTVIEDAGVFDIMGLLAHARLVVASSLHAAITATSYGVPFISFEKVPKCRAFVESWCPEVGVPMIDPPNLAAQMEAAIETPVDLIAAGRRLRASAAAGLSQIIDTIHGDIPLLS